MFGSRWNKWVGQVLTPKADDARIDAELDKVRKATPVPVLWLLGKTQSGKSSIIQGLTGSTEIEIGEGWQACTRSSRAYDFPNARESLIRFLDTRGIGEPYYDPTDDLAYAEKEAAGILVVMQACDPAQEAIKSILAQVRKRKRAWPVILVQTTLHKGYPPGTDHPRPYCFGESPLPEQVPRDLARAIDHQWCDVHGLFDHHVAIDFTHPDDGFEPRLYGIDALWTTLETVLPKGFRAVLAANPQLTAGYRDILYRTAFPHIVSYSLAAGIASAIPIPGANLPGVLLAQTKMLHSIASIYGLPLAGGLEALGAAFGTGFMVRAAARSLLAGIPVVGQTAAGFLTAAATYAMGCALRWYFAEVKRGAVPTAAQIQKVYSEELARGRERFKDYFRARGHDTHVPKAIGHHDSSPS
jgi:uncharacterized protein (DUF697 family)/predicted GTPase